MTIKLRKEPGKKTKEKETKTKKTKTRAAPKAEPKENKKPIQLWVEKMNTSARFRGSAQIRMASEVKNPYGLRRPTGKMALDIALGGGLHAGGVTQVEGAQSVGKTYFCWECVAQLQQIYGEDMNVLYAATELRPDKSHARMAGCCIAYSEHEIEEMERARVAKGLPPFTKEEHADLRLQIGSIVIVMAATAEKLFDVLLEAIEEDNIFQMVIIDSMGALLPKAKDDTDSLSEKTYGGSSIPVTDFMNKLYQILLLDRPDGSMTETTILAINQARARIGGSQWERKTKEAMGAYAWKHGQLVNILLERGSKVRDPPKEGPIVGYNVDWEILKGKAGTHDGLRGSYAYYHFPKMEPVFWKDVSSAFHGGVSYIDEAVGTAIEQGIVKAGGWPAFTKSDGVLVKAQGFDNFANLVSDDPELLQEIKDACFKKANIFVRYK